MIKKISIILISVSCFCYKSSAQSDKKDSDEKAYGDGAIVITAGYGFPNLYKAILKSAAVASNTVNYGRVYTYEAGGVGPFFVKGDYGISKLIGLGANIGYFNASITEKEVGQDQVYNSSTGNYDWVPYEDKTTVTFSSLSIGVRLNFHFATGKKLDPYAGLAAGYTNNTIAVKFKSTSPNHFYIPMQSVDTSIPAYFAFTAGLRYYFTKNIGIYGEIGLDKWSVIQGGLAVKF